MIDLSVPRNGKFETAEARQLHDEMLYLIIAAELLLSQLFIFEIGLSQ